MKSGMEMMLESMGIQTGAIKQLLDPANIKALLGKIEKLCSDVEYLREADSVIIRHQLDVITYKLTRIEIKLGTIPESVAMKLLADGESEAFKDAAEFVRTYNDGNSGDSNNGNGAGDNPGHGNDAISDSGRGI